MSYQPPITIKSAIDNIKKRHYVLPSIQREFVWDTDQIETLFDSLMRDYPISTFLFWKVDKSKVKDFQFYEFLKKYHSKNSRHNKKIELEGDESVIALLDGQQRMTSMYLGLTGSYASKMPYYRKNSAHAYPEKKLYLNLLKPSEEVEVEYDFKFLTEDEAKVSNDTIAWFECSKILQFDEITDGIDYLTEEGLLDSSVYGKESTKFATRTLNKLFRCVHEKGTISYYNEEGEELDKVLQIFIRINSGGTKLSYSDLLLSIATAQWQEKDAREVIHEFVDEINKTGDGFSFNKDLVLKASLVLADFKDIKFKVDNFNKANMETIESNWDETTSAIRAAVELVAKLGFNRNNLAATNTIIPIAYFIYRNKCANDILQSSKHDQNRRAINEWLARVLLKGTFGGQPDSIYPGMRDLINANLGKFPLTEIIGHYKGRRKSISFSEDDIESLLDLQYGKAKTYCALSLLYPGLNHSYAYDQDHLHPSSFFNKKNLRKLGYDENTIDSYLVKFNGLANLQLLQRDQNNQKRAKYLQDWVKAEYPVEESRKAFLVQNHINADQSLAFDDFLPFITARRKNLKTKLMKLLGVTTQNNPVVEPA